MLNIITTKIVYNVKYDTNYGNIEKKCDETYMTIVHVCKNGVMI